MFDIIIELISLFTLLVIYLLITMAGKKLYQLRERGWQLIQGGFFLLLLSAIFDLTDNFPYLNDLVLIGDTPAQALIEKVLTRLTGLVLIAIGFIVWLPKIKKELQQKWDLHQEVRKKTEKLIQANRRLKEAIRNESRLRQNKNQFFNAIAHDIRTPLNAIISLSEIAISNQQNQEFASIHSSCQLLKHFLNELLELSKIESGRAELLLEWGELNDLFKEINDLFFAVAQQKGIRLRVLDHTGSTHALKFDRKHLLQVTCNLISNAIKFTSVGEIVVTFLLQKTEKFRGSLIIEISDTGCGIPKDQIQAIFQPYHQLNTPGRKYGSGLGLYICSELTDLMQGELHVESKEGIGTSFRLKLPVALNPEISLCSEKPQMIYNNVLIADDLDTNRMILARLLEHQATNIHFAEDGEEALEQVQLIQPDLIFLDQQMPKLNGSEVCAQLKANPKTSHIPIILITAERLPREVRETIPCEILTEKPITKSKIQALLVQLEKQSAVTQP